MKTRLSQQQRDHESAEGRPCQSREAGALAASAPPGRSPASKHRTSEQDAEKDNEEIKQRQAENPRSLSQPD